MRGALSRLKALEAAATAGPWEFGPDALAEAHVVRTQDGLYVAATRTWAIAESDARPQDAAFIATARNTYKALLAVAEAAEALLEDDVAGLIEVPAAKWDADLRDLPEYRLKLALEALDAAVPPAGRPLGSDLRGEA